MIYFTRYFNSKSIKIKEHEGEKYQMVNNYMLDKVLDKIKEVIDIVKFNNTKILIDMDDKLLAHIIL